jgi:hypothetical protein
MVTRQRKQWAAVRHCGLHWLNAARYYPCVLLLLALAAPITVTAGPIYDAFVGSIGGFYGNPSSGTIIGNGASGSGMNCSSGGPVNLSISTFNSSFGVPAGGVKPCNYFGGIIENVGSAPQIAATGAVSGTFTSGMSAFQGNASASAGSSSNSSVVLGVQAATSFQGVGDGGGTLAETGAAAAIDDPNWFVSCPTCSPGQTIYPTFTWSISNVDITSNLTAPNLGDFYLDLYSDLNHEGLFTDFEVIFNNGGPGSEPTVECLGDTGDACPPVSTSIPGGYRALQLSLLLPKLTISRRSHWEPVTAPPSTHSSRSRRYRIPMLRSTRASVSQVSAGRTAAAIRSAASRLQRSTVSTPTAATRRFPAILRSPRRGFCARWDWVPLQCGDSAPADRKPEVRAAGYFQGRK